MMLNAAVVIEDYNELWPQMYEAERKRLQNALGNRITSVEHIGSAAVPGLGAKPIIDIMLGLYRLESAVTCIAPLEDLGYQYVPEFEAELPDRRYFRRNTDGIRSHHLHMVQEGGDFWKRQLLFRDYLRMYPDSAHEYELVKRSLAGRFGSDREGYTNAKTDFVITTLERARQTWDK